MSNSGNLTVEYTSRRQIRGADFTRDLTKEEEFSKGTSPAYAKRMLETIANVTESGVKKVGRNDSDCGQYDTLHLQNGMKITYESAIDTLSVDQNNKFGDIYGWHNPHGIEMKSHWYIFLDSTSKELKALGAKAQANVKRLIRSLPK